jgi:hypothetical protein
LTVFSRRMDEPSAYKPKRRVTDNGCMKILNLIHVMLAQAFYDWALREINPLHPDLPRIVLRQKELADKAQRIFA